MSNAELSVIVPVYNGERFLGAALQSIRSQGTLAIEIIVVDDGSTDGSADIARRTTDVRYVWQTNRGPAAARNKGLEIASSDFIAFLDADDLWAPNKLRLQMPLLRDSDVEVVSGHIQCVKLTGSGDWSQVGEPRLLPNFGAATVKREVFDRVGRLDESLRSAEDVDWFMRARHAGVRTMDVADVVLFYRLHDSNLTRGLAPREVGYARAVKNLLDERRTPSR